MTILDRNLETNILSKNFFLMGLQKTPLQKSYKLPTGAQSYIAKLTSANRQFNWLEISLVIDKSEKHSTIYNSNNARVASTLMQNVSIENIVNTYSLTNGLKFDIDDVTEKHISSSSHEIIMYVL